MSRTRSVLFWSFLSAGVTAGVGIAINLATELKTNLLAWIVVCIFTLAAGAATTGLQRSSQPSKPRQDRHPIASGTRSSYRVDTRIRGDSNTVYNNNIAGDGTITQGPPVNGWTVFLALGVSSIVTAGTLVGINVATSYPTGGHQQEPAAASSTETSPVLAASVSWPLLTGCEGLTQVAMPAGRGGIHDFHAATDITSTFADSGAGSWTTGLLYLDLSTVNGKSVHIQNILPKRTRRDLASPAWIYTPDDGCGPPPESRLFTYNLDTGTFKDEGTPNSDLNNLPPSIPAAPLGPGFVISGSEHFIVQVSTLSCRGNYEWNLDIQYVVTGTEKIEHHTAGPFQSYGAASNTVVYRGHQDDTGGIQVDDTSTLTGNDDQGICE